MTGEAHCPGAAALCVGQFELSEPFMFPFFFPQSRKSPEDLQRESNAKDAQELKEYLDSLTPEDRAKFWAEIEGNGDAQKKRTP
jgi:hypothetical protein